MKAKMNWLAVVLTLCLIVSSVLVVASAAGETALAPEATVGGIQASLVTTKDSYAEKEAIDVSLYIGNLSGADVANVSTSITAPGTLSLANGTLEKTYDELGAAQLLQNKVTVSLGDLEDNPATGTEIITVAAVVVMLASAAGLAFMLITGKIRMNKTFCLLLLAGVMLVGLIPNAYAAETEEKKVEVAKEITVDGQKVTLTATVTWEEAPAPVITRADMEAVINEILWDFYLKGEWIQYDSTGFSKGVSGIYGGFGATSDHLNTLEDANSQQTMFSVCSKYPWLAYYEAFDFPVFGYMQNAHSDHWWLYSFTTVKDQKVNDMIVATWHGYGGDYTTVEYDGVHGGVLGGQEGYMNHDKCLDTFDELKDFIANWEENLRPGDVIRVPGHILVYAGDGYILHSNGYKYDTDYGYDVRENEGTIVAQTVESCFLPETQYEGLGHYQLDRFLSNYVDGDWVYMPDMETTTEIAIIRPLNILTIPDSDDDPSNDVLDIDFVYDGVDRAQWQYSFDKVGLPHSGYTIQPSAYTRMQYPGMNIDRSVNITPYGTATKGETITYTVAVYNESNDAKYTDSKKIGGDENYAGVNYEGLSVTETLPENVELVSAEGATIIGNTLYWNVDIAAGECAKLTYTVKVTGEIGDEIVSGGGWVGAIPSNTIVNTIGGQKLSDEIVENMKEFYEVGKDVWNSNEGLKISAALKDTEFAERIYNAAAGLDLDIPDAQTLLDTLFTQEYIKVDQGMSTAWNKSAAAWMFTLNDTTAKAEDQIWRDMLVDGFFGGNWVWTNNYDPDVRRIYYPSVDNVEPGDILVSMTLSTSNGKNQEARTVEGWQVMVYLGDGYFASLKAVKKTDDTYDYSMTCMQGPRYLLSMMNSDVFLALRPSQAYENINEEVPAFTGSFADLTDADMSPKHTSVIYDAVLEDWLCAKIAALTPKDIAGEANFGPHMISFVYSMLRMDISDKFPSNVSMELLLNRLFNDIPSDSWAYQTIGVENHLLEQPEKGFEGVYDMLAYYGGHSFVDGKPITSMDDLRIGDGIVVPQRQMRICITMIYQGVNENGKHQFLAAVQGHDYKYYARTFEFADTDAFNEFINGHVPTRDFAGETEHYWEGYIVLRPSRVYENINPEEVNRDITDGALNSTEKDKLVNIKPEDYVYSDATSQLNGFIQWAYGQAMVNVNRYINKPLSDVQDLLFDGTALKPVDEKNKYIHTMLIGKDSNLIPLKDELKIGDIFVWNCNNGNDVYCIALYQGDGKFLVHSSTSEQLTVMTYEEILATKDTSAWTCWFALRPEKVAAAVDDGFAEIRDIITGKLTDTEKDILANIKPEEYVFTGETRQLNGFTQWVYKQAFINVDLYFKDTMSGAQNQLFNGGKVGNLNSLTPANKYYIAMVLGKDTGFIPAQADLQIGDIFAWRYNSGGNVYCTALYQGNGNFLVHYASSGQLVVMTYDEVLATKSTNEWSCWYALRPENVMDTPEVEEVEIRDISTGKLTEAEKTMLAALTPDNYVYASSVAQLNGFAQWAYKQANIDVSKYINATLQKTHPKLFADSFGPNVLAPDAEGADANLLKMLLSEKADDIPAKDKLQIGDLLCYRFKGETSNGTENIYHIALYQGNGNFLVHTTHRDHMTKLTVKTYEEIVTILEENKLAEEKFTLAFVLRPENVAAETTPEGGNPEGGNPEGGNPEGGNPEGGNPEGGNPEGGEGGETVVVRDLAANKLTDAEKAALAGIAAEAYTGASGTIQLNGFVQWAYQQANIDVAKFINLKFSDTQKKLFKDGFGDVLAPDAEGADANLLKMLLSTKIDEIPQKDALQIGDLLCYRYKEDTSKGNENIYYIALYQGNGNFLVHTTHRDHITTLTVKTYEEIVAALNAHELETEKATACFTLRPENIATAPEGGTPEGGTPEGGNPEGGNPEGGEGGETVEIRDLGANKLTEGEKNLLAALKREQYKSMAESGYNLNGFATWAYQQANIDVTQYLKDTMSGTQGKLFRDNKMDQPKDRADENATYFDMVVGREAGYLPLKDDLQIGDLFCFRFKPADVGNVYCIALYQGNGNFLLHNTKENTLRVMTYEQILATKEPYAWTAWFVLRPENVASAT